MDREYIASGRFIHDELRRRCEAAVAKLYDIWRKDKRILPSLLLWPNDSVRTVEGTGFTGVVFTELSEDEAARPAEIRSAAAQCNAFGLLLTEQLPGVVRVVFETEHGTRAWRLPIKKHGDVQVLGRPSISDNTDSIGVRWTAN